MKSDPRLLCEQINTLISSDLNLTLPKLANLIGIDRRRIEKSLREQYCCGFREFKNQARLNYIMELLARNIRINDIANAVGVTPNAISRFIRKMKGKCARELRNRMIYRKSA
jgi:plasmid maintenance system antidote protein VapI